ncbi:MAG: transposase [Daejeonella sp.]
MSRSYKFQNPEGIYFVSFATVNWIDVFVRPIYNDIIVQNLIYCKNNLGLNLFCWCIMPSHVHLIFRALENNPSVLLGRFKEYTSKTLVKTIEQNIQESGRDWMLPMFRKAGAKSSNVQVNQFWQHDNHPIELWSPEVSDQKVEYVHNNPVVAGFVEEAWHWKYSSAVDYYGSKGLIEIEFL